MCCLFFLACLSCVHAWNFQASLFSFYFFLSLLPFVLTKFAILSFCAITVGNLKRASFLKGECEDRNMTAEILVKGMKTVHVKNFDESMWQILHHWNSNRILIKKIAIRTVVEASERFKVKYGPYFISILKINCNSMSI